MLHKNIASYVRIVSTLFHLTFGLRENYKINKTSTGATWLIEAMGNSCVLSFLGVPVAGADSRLYPSIRDSNSSIIFQMLTVSVYVRNRGHNKHSAKQFILIIATSKKQLARMLQELADATAQVGFGLHAGKTKVLSNVAEECRKGDKFIEVRGRKVEILARMETTMYLGWALSFEATQDKGETPSHQHCLVEVYGDEAGAMLQEVFS